MEQITRRYKGGKHTFTVYTVQEAQTIPIPYVHWKDAVADSWASTDDGYVAEVIGVKLYTDRSGHVRKHVRLSIGVNFVSPSSRIDFLVNRAYNTYSEVKPRTWQEQEARKGRTKNLVKVYVKQLITGTINYDQLGQVYRRDEQIPAATVKRVLKQKVIKKMVEIELQKVLEEKGITQEYAIDMLKKAIEIAENRSDPGNMIKGIQTIDDLVSLFPKKEKGALIGFEMGITRELGETVQRIDKELAEKTAVEADSEEVHDTTKE